MEEQTTLNEAKAHMLIEDPRFRLGNAWQTPAVARALSNVAPFEDATYLNNAIRAFVSARATPAKIDCFLKLWTAVNALCGHVAVRFEAAQATHLHLEPSKLPTRYHIQMTDNASMGALAALIDPAHLLPHFTALHAPAFRDAQRTLGTLAEGLLHECEQNPEGALAQLSEAPCPIANNDEAATATEKLFALADELDISPLVFVLLVASYELRNGLIHGSVPLPLFPGERIEELSALNLCSLVLDAFLDRTLPQATKQIDADDGRMAPFPEPYREAIAHFLDHRLDGLGLCGFLRKYGLLW